MGLVMSLLLFPVVHSPSNAHKYVFYGLRLLALPLAIVMFVTLVRNFYKSDPSTACSWCRYLSCWPSTFFLDTCDVSKAAGLNLTLHTPLENARTAAQNNRCKGTGLSTVTASSTSSTVSTLLFSLVSTLVLPLV